VHAIAGDDVLRASTVTRGPSIPGTTRSSEPHKAGHAAAAVQIGQWCSMEQHAAAVRVVDELGDVALLGGGPGERFDPRAQRAALLHRVRVRDGSTHHALDDVSKTLVAQRGAHRGDQLDRQVVVAIGKEIWASR